MVKQTRSERQIWLFLPALYSDEDSNAQPLCSEENCHSLTNYGTFKMRLFFYSVFSHERQILVGDKSYLCILVAKRYGYACPLTSVEGNIEITEYEAHVTTIGVSIRLGSVDCQDPVQPKEWQ